MEYEILDACPYCGSHAHAGGSDHVCYVQCVRCGMAGPESECKDAAVERWNKLPRRSYAHELETA